MLKNTYNIYILHGFYFYPMVGFLMHYVCSTYQIFKNVVFTSEKKMSERNTGQ